jgi:uncharacterized membrane protein (DUF2068 family)
MKRQAGITVSAIVLILGSLLQLLSAFGAAAAGFVEHGQIASGGNVAAKAGATMPAWLPGFMYGFSAFLVALAVWGILTAVGLFRLRRWARYSVLVIGGCLALIGLPSLLMMLVMMAVPLPMLANADPSQAQMVHTFTKVMFGVISAFYGIVCAVGVSWLVYFNRRQVREVFAGMPGQLSQGQTTESRRPMMISVLAVFIMIGAPMCLIMVFAPFPAAILGLILHGWVKAAVFLVYGALMAAAGVGLWRLEEWARRLALAMQVVGLAQLVLYIIRPSLITDYSAEVNQAMNVPQPQSPAQLQTMMYDVSFGFGALLFVAIVWILIHYRGVFRHPNAPAQIESPA